MKNKHIKKFLYIVCSLFLVFSMCVPNFNLNVSADEPQNTQTQEISETENDSDVPATETNTPESNKEVPDQISVQTLEQTSSDDSTDRVEYVDEKGKIIEGAPTTIELGTIAEHKDLAITGKHYEFKSARINGKDCVYIGKYNDTVYYSTDGVIAIKLDDGQKLTMTYQEYYNIRVKEEILEGGVAGTITTKAGTVKVNTADTIRVNAGETWKFTVKPGTANKIRYKIGSVTAADASSTSITRVSGDEYEANYEANFQKDDTVMIAYDKEGVYRVTINRTASDGTEYLNEGHSKKALDFTFTENDLDADGAITIPVIHTKRGYRLINMAINGTTLAGTTDNNVEIPTEKGTGHGITMDANCGDTSYLVTVVMEDSFTTHIGDEKNCSYAYSIKIKPRRGNWQDINLNLVPYATGQQVLTVKLYTGSGHRSGDGLDVAMWNPDTKKLDPIHDSDTVNMDSVGNGAETLHKRQVRIFFAKSKNGYYSPTGAFKAFANETSSGGRVIAETGKVAQLSATTMGETGTLAIYDEIWQEAKNAAQAAGYTEYVAFAGEKTLNTDWEMYVVSFTTTGIGYYVHYNSGAGEGVLPKDALVNNIPYNQETNNQNKPMQSYGGNPSTNKGARSMGTTFVMGENCPEPTCKGYEFVGWRLKNKSGKLSDTLYKHGDLFTIAEDNYVYANNTNLPVCSWTDMSGYQIVAQWKKIDTKKVEVKHWLKKPDGNEVIGKTTDGSITFSKDNETVTAMAKPEPNGAFLGYIFDKSDERNTLEKTVTNDGSTDAIVLNLYYKPTVLTVSKNVSGYNLEPNRDFEFVIQANPQDGKTMSDIYVQKNDGNVEKLSFTNNQAMFTMKKDETVNISCLPTDWTYTVTEKDPGSNFVASYVIDAGTKINGCEAKFTMPSSGSTSIKYTNTSTLSPPVTGMNINNSDWSKLGIIGLICLIIGFIIERFKKIRR